MVFKQKPAATIKAKNGADATENISIGGVTTANTTPENAKAQIDKLVGIVGKSVSTAGMTRTFVEEASE